MHEKAQELITFLQHHGGVARFSTILNAGFYPELLSALQHEEKIKKVSRGLYMLTNNITGSYPDFVVASLQSRRGIVCLISALSFYEATNEIPQCINIAIPRGTHANKIKYPPVRFYQFALTAWEAGITEHEIDGHKVRIYSLAKTIADCFKFRNKIGVNVARDSLKIAIMEKNIPPREIMHYAKICRVANVIKPFLESIL